MFGVSFSEVVLIAVVTLIVVGPRRLPEILGQLGRWVGRLRQMTTEMRRQTGIDEILRQEGFQGGIGELRSMLRGDLATLQRFGTELRTGHVSGPDAVVDAYGEAVAFDRFREYPLEGPDAYGAIPEDLVDPSVDNAPPGPPPAPISEAVTAPLESGTPKSAGTASSQPAPRAASPGASDAPVAPKEA